MLLDPSERVGVLLGHDVLGEYEGREGDTAVVGKSGIGIRDRAKCGRREWNPNRGKLTTSLSLFSCNADGETFPRPRSTAASLFLYVFLKRYPGRE